MGHQAILLPGSVLPKDLAYDALRAALGDGVDARAKDLEVYATDEPPDGYGLQTEIDGVLREADDAGFERFHLVGYSGGGAISTAFVARHPDRVLSLSLLEPAWIGNEGMTETERETWVQFERIADLPAEEMMPRFVRTQLAPGSSRHRLPRGRRRPGWPSARRASGRSWPRSGASTSTRPACARSSGPSTTRSGRSAIPATSARWPSACKGCSPTTRSTSTSAAITSILPPDRARAAGRPPARALGSR